MELISIICIVVFFALLGTALYMLIDFYVCDAETCKAFRTADEEAEKGTQQYIVTLLKQVFNDGIWSVPYIAAAISTPIALWFMSVPITVKNFAYLFLVSFAVMYFALSFFGHHYVRIINTYVVDWIDDQEIPENN